MTTDAVTIGLLRAADVDDALALAVLADVPAGDREAWERDVAAQAADGRPRPGARVLLGAWAGDRLVGLAVGAVAVDDADVHLVVVAPEHRRDGIGGRLTRALCTALRAHGVGPVLLEVRVGNDAARRLYEALGFEEVARRRSYYRDGEDAVVLRQDPS